MNAAIPESDVARLAEERKAALAAASATPPPAPSPAPPAAPAPGTTPAPIAETPAAPAPPALLTEDAMRFGAECIFNPLFRWKKVEPLDDEELDICAKGYTPAFNKYMPGLLTNYPELYMFTAATFSIVAPRMRRTKPQLTPEVESRLKAMGWQAPEFKVPDELLRELSATGWKPPQLPVRREPAPQEKKVEFTT